MDRIYQHKMAAETWIQTMLDLSLSDFLQFVMAMRSGMLFHTLNECV
jgi:hypothetical protein